MLRIVKKNMSARGYTVPVVIQAKLRQFHRPNSQCNVMFLSLAKNFYSSRSPQAPELRNCLSSLNNPNIFKLQLCFISRQFIPNGGKSFDVCLFSILSCTITIVRVIRFLKTCHFIILLTICAASVSANRHQMLRSYARPNEFTQLEAIHASIIKRVPISNKEHRPSPIARRQK